MTRDDFNELDIGQIVLWKRTGMRLQITKRMTAHNGFGYSAVPLFGADSSPWDRGDFMLNDPGQYEPDRASTDPTQHGFEIGYRAQSERTDYVAQAVVPTGLTCVQKQRWMSGFDKGRDMAWRHLGEVASMQLNLKADHSGQ